jgi:hypothetical protein
MNLQFLEINDFAATIIVSTCMTLCIAAMIAFISGRLLWLSPEHKIYAFIIGLALTSGLAITQFAPIAGWNTTLLLCALPALVIFIYFIPTFLAIAMGCEIFRGVFLVNLALGWTVVGYIAAVMMAFRPEQREDYSDLSIRLTPLGVVPRTGIGYTADERLASVQRELSSAQDA